MHGKQRVHETRAFSEVYTDLALCPKLYTPISTTADEQVALEWRPLNSIDRPQMPTVCLQILLIVRCAALIDVTVLSACYVHALIPVTEIK